ncbi:MAG: DUF350 domain-containing protein [Planctomycetales bacterium]
MPETIQAELWQLIPTVVYFIVGLVLFGSSIFLMDKLTPFSIRKEIEEDQNTALAILMGACILGLAILLSAAIK